MLVRSIILPDNTVAVVPLAGMDNTDVAIWPARGVDLQNIIGKRGDGAEQGGVSFSRQCGSDCQLDS